MKQLVVLVPHNKLPHLHDLATIHFKKILSKLQERTNLKIIWVMFPTEEGTYFDTNNDPHVIYASKYHNALEIIEEIKPDLVLINGSLDFHNVNISMVCRFKNIPIVTIFFRNFQHVTSNSSSKSIRSRSRKIFSMPNFYIKQIIFLSRTLQKINFPAFKLIKFILSYSKMIIFSYFPISKDISGDINLCTNYAWKKKLIEYGFEDSSILVVGDPYFDSLFTEIQDSKLRTKVDLDSVKILFCTSTMFGHGLCSRKEENNLIIDTSNEILKHSDLKISLKIHPSTASKEDYLKEVLPKLSTSISLHQQENLLELINQNDIILTYGGTGAIHYGVLMKKPIVNLDFMTNATGNNVFSDDKIITQCKSLSNLISDIRQANKKVISDEDVAKYIEKYIGIFDGKNSERSADAIFNFLSDRITL